MTPERIHFFGGKGGVGKTTLAAATALGLAQTGHKTLLISTDPAHSLGDLLDLSLGDEPREVFSRLWVRELDPETARAAYIESVKANIRRFAAPEFLQAAERQVELAGQHPGAMESALFEALCQQLDRLDDWDHIVVDTAPTGHTLHLLTLPESMQAWTQALLAHQLSAPRGNLSEKEDPRRQARALLQARQALFQRTRERLQCPKTTRFVLVVNDDRLSVSEGRRAHETLLKAGVSVPCLIVNRAERVPPSVAEAFTDQHRFALPAQTPAPQGLAGLQEVAEALRIQGFGAV